MEVETKAMRYELYSVYDYEGLPYYKLEKESEKIGDIFDYVIDDEGNIIGSDYSRYVMLDNEPVVFNVKNFGFCSIPSQEKIRGIIMQCKLCRLIPNVSLEPDEYMEISKLIEPIAKKAADELCEKLFALEPVIKPTFLLETEY